MKERELTDFVLAIAAADGNGWKIGAVIFFTLAKQQWFRDWLSARTKSKTCRRK
jgi:hypothetical protein